MCADDSFLEETFLSNRVQQYEQAWPLIASRFVHENLVITAVIKIRLRRMNPADCILSVLDENHKCVISG